jgi:hypothetical protein
MRPTAFLLPLFVLVGCATTSPTPRLEPSALNAIRNQGKRSFTAADVVDWACLQDYLGEHPIPIVPGLADDKEVLGRLVMLQNASEVAAFVKEHRGIRVTRLTKVTQLRSALVVEVEAVSADGQSVILVLLSDGTPQGEG